MYIMSHEALCKFVTDCHIKLYCIMFPLELYSIGLCAQP